MGHTAGHRHAMPSLTISGFPPIMPPVPGRTPSESERCPVLIIGELINSTRKQIRKAIEEKDAAYIQGLAKKQVEAGANWIDVNAGAFPHDEVEKLLWSISVIREVTDAPLSIDSPRPAAVEAGLSSAGREPLLNSISAESERYTTLIPLVKRFHTRVIALSMDDNGMTDDMGKVWEVADRLIKRLEDDGVIPDYIFVDPLIRPVSTNGEYGSGALWLMERISVAHPDVHKTCGLSNVSYGLPRRRLVNQVFMAMAIARGLDSAIIDPLDAHMMAHIFAAEALAGKDQFCMNYIAAERAGKLEGMA
jgi:cobalamin-dependent methionine synthase I